MSTMVLRSGKARKFEMWVIRSIWVKPGWLIRKFSNWQCLCQLAKKYVLAIQPVPKEWVLYKNLWTVILQKFSHFPVLVQAFTDSAFDSAKYPEQRFQLEERPADKAQVLVQ